MWEKLHETYVKCLHWYCKWCGLDSLDRSRTDLFLSEPVFKSRSNRNFNVLIFCCLLLFFFALYLRCDFSRNVMISTLIFYCALPTPVKCCKWKSTNVRWRLRRRRWKKWGDDENEDDAPNWTTTTAVCSVDCGSTLKINQPIDDRFVFCVWVCARYAATERESRSRNSESQPVKRKPQSLWFD